MLADFLLNRKCNFAYVLLDFWMESIASSWRVSVQSRLDMFFWTTGKLLFSDEVGPFFIVMWNYYFSHFGESFEVFFDLLLHIMYLYVCHDIVQLRRFREFCVEFCVPVKIKKKFECKQNKRPTKARDVRRVLQSACPPSAG